ncbi:MAG: glycosyltransferase, partial [Oscillospiraceae bacterium]
MKITASIVCYGGFEDVQKCVDSLLACTQKYPLRLYIIDNLSPDDTAQRLKKAYGENSQITLLFNEKN